MVNLATTPDDRSQLIAQAVQSPAGVASPELGGWAAASEMLKNLLGGFLDRTDASGTTTQGWGMPVLQGLGSVGNLYMGMRQYGLGRDMLRENRRQFDADYNNQRTLVNSQLEDRQRARVASNPGAYESVGAYMDKNRIR